LPRAAYWFGYGGLLPFVAGAVLVLVWPETGARTWAGRALLGYGAFILSCLAVVHWRVLQPARQPRAWRGLIATVLLPLAGWAALLLPFEKAAAVQVAALGGFWLYEHRLLGPAVLGNDYLALRRWQTLVMITALGLALMAPSLVPTVS
jgi:hypothetical protein